MIPIKTTKTGYEILYDPDDKKFVAQDSKHEEIYKADKQQEVENYLKKLEKKAFTRIKAIHRLSRTATLGEITSIRTEHSRYSGYYYEAWFVSGEGENKRRGKHRIGEHFFLATIPNVALAETITKLNEQITEKYAKIDRLQQRFKDPITDKNVLKFAGVEA